MNASVHVCRCSRLHLTRRTESSEQLVLFQRTGLAHCSTPVSLPWQFNFESLGKVGKSPRRLIFLLSSNPMNPACLQITLASLLLQSAHAIPAAGCCVGGSKRDTLPTETRVNRWSLFLLVGNLTMWPACT